MIKEEGEHVDFRALDELKQIMGEEFSLLIETFSNDSVVRIELIKEAVSNAEPDAIRRTAHSFKGSASNMGAPQLTELCRQLEELGFNKQVEGSQELMNKIIKEYDLVQEALMKL